MVNLGPSTGCKTCRRRKIKCDGHDPCHRCLRRNLPCPGLPNKKAFGVLNPSPYPGQTELSLSCAALPEQKDSRDIGTWEHNCLESMQYAADKQKRRKAARRQMTSFITKWCDQDSASNEVDPMVVFLPQPTINWKDVSVSLYISFLQSDPGDLDPWTIAAANSGSKNQADHPYFNDALAAVSLQRLSKHPDCRVLQQHAGCFYGRALKLFGKVLEDAEHISSDTSLVTIKLLIIYSFNEMSLRQTAPKSEYESEGHGSMSLLTQASHGPVIPEPSQCPSKDNAASVSLLPQNASSSSLKRDPLKYDSPATVVISPHFDGLLQLLLVRGPKQLEDKMSCRLFHSSRDRIIANYSHRCQRLPVHRTQRKWRWFFETAILTPADALTTIAIDVPMIRFHAANLSGRSRDGFCSPTARALKTEAYKVLSSLQVWYSELLDQVQRPRAVQMDKIELRPSWRCGYEGVGTVYASPQIGVIVGRYHAYKIMLLQIISTCIEAEMSDDYAADYADDTGASPCSDELLLHEASITSAKQRAIVNAICAILVVYNLRDEKVYELGQEIGPGGSHHGGHLIEPILISQSVSPPLPAHQLKFLGLKLKELLGEG